MTDKTQTITLTLTQAEARAIEGQLIDIQKRREGYEETVDSARREFERLESARIRISRALDKIAQAK